MVEEQEVDCAERMDCFTVSHFCSADPEPSLTILFFICQSHYFYDEWI